MLDTGYWSDGLATIDASKIDCFREHLLRLDEDARLERFCHTVSDAYLHEYCRCLDLTAVRIIGFLADGRVHAAAELRPTGSPRSRVVEATISVEKNWQGQGIGTALMLRTIAISRALGANHILLDCLAGNERLRRVIARLDADLLFGDDDCMAWLPLAAMSRGGSAQVPVPALR